jgi:hypothetical protein
MLRRNIDTAYQTEIITAIKNRSDLVFITYSGLENTVDKIKYALAKILEQFKREEIFTPLLSCIKELIANAAKANAKTILINEEKITDPENLAEVAKKVQSVLNEEGLLEYGIKAKQHRLSTRTYLKVHGNNLIIEVVNNTPLSSRELKRINERIDLSSKYDNIAEFFMENPDPEAEGMGLGLSMVVVLLKNINISHKNFMITTDGNSKTYATILVPLTYAIR